MNAVSRNLTGLTALAVICVALPTIGPAHATGNTAIEALQQTPVSLFTYGLAGLNETVTGYFVGNPPPSALFAPPLSGKMADIVPILYDADAETITINLVKIEKLADGATADDACKQAFAGVRSFAGLDPATGQLQPGMDASLLATAFTVAGTVVKAPANDLSTLDQAFRLRFNGQTAAGRFSCTAPLFGTGYTLAK